MSLQVEGEALTNDGEHIFDTSRVESAKNSNSITDDSDTAMSACVDVNYGYGHAMGKDIASTSSKWPDCDYPQVLLFSSDGTKEPISESSGRNSDVVLGCHGEFSNEYGLQMRQMLKEKLVEFGVDLTYGCSDDANACQERRANKEVEDCNLSSGLGSTNYILSSGRNSVNIEPLNSTKRSTIDKEFEEYFSMLMMKRKDAVLIAMSSSIKDELQVVLPKQYGDGIEPKGRYHDKTGLVRTFVNLIPAIN